MLPAGSCSQKSGTNRRGCSPGGNGTRDCNARIPVQRAQYPCREGDLEMEPAEQDAAIRSGNGDSPPALRLHRFRIATLLGEGDQRLNRRVTGPNAVVGRKLLGLRRWVGLLTLTVRPAGATRPSAVRLGLLAASMGGGRRVGRTCYAVAATTATLGIQLGSIGRLLRLGRAAARSAGEPL